MWIQDHLPDGKWLQAHLPDPKSLPKRAMNVGVGLSSPLWPTFIAAAGAGVAFWWWTNWARGRAETEAQEATAIAAGVAAPETIMAHAPAPAVRGSEPVDPSDAELVAPAEALMAHTPPPLDLEAAARGASEAPLVGLDGEAVDAVDASLGVQDAAAKPKPRAKRKPAAAAPTTH